MSDHAFLFALRLSGASRFDAMLADLASNVLLHIGLSPAVVDELSRQLRAALPPVVPAGADLDVRFKAHGGEIEIVVAQNDRRILRLSWPLP